MAFRENEEHRESLEEHQESLVDGNDSATVGDHDVSMEGGEDSPRNNTVPRSLPIYETQLMINRLNPNNELDEEPSPRPEWLEKHYDLAFKEFTERFGRFCTMPKKYIRLDENYKLNAIESFHASGINCNPNVNLRDGKERGEIDVKGRTGEGVVARGLRRPVIKADDGSGFQVGFFQLTLVSECDRGTLIEDMMHMCCQGGFCQMDDIFRDNIAIFGAYLENPPDLNLGLIEDWGTDESVPSRIVTPDFSRSLDDPAEP
uniref:Retrotransposon protein n=1 Tax=Steinernema glaseri TaxID=37863 RepID=A0A1I7Y8G7_9BILA